MISRENAEHYVWRDVCDGWHLVKTAELSVIQERMPSGTSEVRHYHNAARQFFFVLLGTATIEIDGRREILRAHEGVEVPPKTPHQMFNKSDQSVEFLVISQPASHGDRILAESEVNL